MNRPHRKTSRTTTLLNKLLATGKVYYRIEVAYHNIETGKIRYKILNISDVNKYEVLLHTYRYRMRTYNNGIHLNKERVVSVTGDKMIYLQDYNMTVVDGKYHVVYNNTDIRVRAGMTLYVNEEDKRELEELNGADHTIPV